MNVMFIKSDKALKKTLPNVIALAKAESPLFEKMEPFIFQAERWIAQEITGEKNLAAIAKRGDTVELKRIMTALVSNLAFSYALPSLDVTLTANGFATVGNATLVTASKARMERLADSLKEQADRLLETIFPLLADFDDWKEDIGPVFCQTVFPFMTAPALMGVPYGKRFSWLSENLPTILSLEDKLAVEFFSHPLMNRLRCLNPLTELEAPERHVLKLIQAVILKVLKEELCDYHSITDIVEYIRNRPDDFPLWHNSRTAQLFEPPIFKNKKNAPGYFF